MATEKDYKQKLEEQITTLLGELNMRSGDVQPKFMQEMRKHLDKGFELSEGLKEKIRSLHIGDTAPVFASLSADKNSKAMVKDSLLLTVDNSFSCVLRYKSSLSGSRDFKITNPQNVPYIYMFLNSSSSIHNINQNTTPSFTNIISMVTRILAFLPPQVLSTKEGIASTKSMIPLILEATYNHNISDYAQIIAEDGNLSYQDKQAKMAEYSSELQKAIGAVTPEMVDQILSTVQAKDLANENAKKNDNLDKVEL